MTTRNPVASEKLIVKDGRVIASQTTYSNGSRSNYVENGIACNMGVSITLNPDGTFHYNKRGNGDPVIYDKDTGKIISFNQ